MARIRTIKPEFWMNEALACIPEHARLLAIALLNHADDKGYFLANPALVRAACFPFEEHSKNVLGSLQELSRIGYIEVRDCDGKAIGRICKFTDHQRIDKPQKSKLEHVFCDFPSENSDSKNIPGTFQESSGNSPRLEQGTGNREVEQGKEYTHTHTSDPPIVPKGLEDAWEKWTGYIMEKFGRSIGAIEAQTVLMDLMGRGIEKAARDIDFTIRVSKDGKRILDSDNDFEKVRNRGAPTTRKTTPAEGAMF
jgi:hypothetical protein